MNTKTNNDMRETNTNPNPLSKVSMIYLGGYKAFKDIQEIPIKPITLIFGPNSSGKSSLLKGLKIAVSNSINSRSRDELFSKNNLNTCSNEMVFGLNTNNYEWPPEIAAAMVFADPNNLANLKYSQYTVSVEKLIYKYESNGKCFAKVQNSDCTIIVNRLERKSHRFKVSNKIDGEYFEIPHQYKSRFDEVDPEYLAKALSLMQDAMMSIAEMPVSDKETRKQKSGAKSKLSFSNVIKDGIDNAIISFDDSGLLKIESLKENEICDFYLIDDQWRSEESNKMTIIDEFNSNVKTKHEEIKRNGFILDELGDMIYMKKVAEDIKNTKEFNMIDLAALAHRAVMSILVDYYYANYNLVKKLINPGIKMLSLGPERVCLDDITETTTEGDKQWLDFISRNENLDKINEWLQDKEKLSTNFKIIKSIKLKSKNELENLVSGAIDINHVELGLTDGLRIIDNRTDSRALSFDDVGYGIQKLIPVIAAAAATKNDAYDLISIEEPEMHLHPKLQSDLGDLFVNNVINNSEKTFILETHSENLLQRILRRVREGVISHEAISVLYVKPGSVAEGAEVINLRIDERGKFLDRWPEGFFEPRMDDVISGFGN